MPRKLMFDDYEAARNRMADPSLWNLRDLMLELVLWRSPEISNGEAAVWYLRLVAERSSAQLEGGTWACIDEEFKARWSCIAERNDLKVIVQLNPIEDQVRILWPSEVAPELVELRVLEQRDGPGGELLVRIDYLELFDACLRVGVAIPVKHGIHKGDGHGSG